MALREQSFNPEVEAGLRCAACGNIYAPDSTFCRKCGVKRPLSHRSLPAEFSSTHSVPLQITPVPVYPIATASAAQNLFDQLDTNHDGVITREEYARLSLFDH